MKSLPTISVIIPTHNRKDSLLRSLDSLRQQTFPVDRFEVVVVDDGSTDGTQTVASQPFPFKLRYLHQKNQGATAARNYGATTSQSEILVFIDDDVTISPYTLEALAEACCQQTKVLVMGTIHSRSNDTASVYTPIMLNAAANSMAVHDDIELNSVECNSELLACKRSDFLDIGMFQDPTAGNGWPNWDDVDFGYRAHLKGFRLLETGKAIAEHWDYSISSRTLACHRLYRVGRSAVWLFKRHPGVQPLIPMFHDKTPPAWGQDAPRLIARKLVRQFLSSSALQIIVVKLVGILERHYPSPVVLRRLYSFLHGASLFQGYRQGLREYKLAGVQE